jgi:hypothetical protein
MRKIEKDLKITPILEKLLEYKRSWIKHVNRMPRNRLPRVMKHYSQLAEEIMVISGNIINNTTGFV